MTINRKAARQLAVVAAAGWIMIVGSAALAGERTWRQWYGDRKYMVDLISDGYEIKAAVRAQGQRPSNSSVNQIFLQKGTSVFLCVDIEGDDLFPDRTVSTCAPLQKPQLQR